MNVLDPPMRLQRVLGLPRIAWMFVSPNLAIFSLFTFLAIVGISILRLPAGCSSVRRSARLPKPTHRVSARLRHLPRSDGVPQGPVQF